MKAAIPLFGDRVAPRCTAADSLLVCEVEQQQVVRQDRIAHSIQDEIDLYDMVQDHKVQILICGGINRKTRESLASLDVSIVPNTAGTVAEILLAVTSGDILSGSVPVKRNGQGQASDRRSGDDEIQQVLRDWDCIQCSHRVCASGFSCPLLPAILDDESAGTMDAMLETARDIKHEKERRLCRLSELVYFCLDMDYRNLGVAYCTDLETPAKILTSVLRRFFKVHPVCCMLKPESSTLGTLVSETPETALRCQPEMQARLLNRLGTDFNILVGLCIGADSVFTRISNAPVTTLFVKDRALANNPVGAIYSEQYLTEASHPRKNHDVKAADVNAASRNEKL